MTPDQRIKHMAETLGSFLGIAAFLKDCKELGICPDYLQIESRMIELFDNDQKTKEQL